MLRSDQIAAVSLRACYPEFIWLKWLVLCCETSLYWLCCSPALSQPSSSRQSKQSPCGPGLSGSDGTSVSWKGSAIPALKEDFLPAVCSRGIFTIFACRSFVQRKCERSLLRQWMSWSGCDKRSPCLWCCSAWDPPTDVQAGGSCHSPVTLSEWWKGGSGSQSRSWRVFMWIDKLNSAAVALQKMQVRGIIYISDRT